MKVCASDELVERLTALRLKSRESWILPTFLVAHAIILSIPYWLNGYDVPVGWDTPYYIRNVKIIADKGLYAFFQELKYVSFYSIFEYLLCVLLHTTPIALKTFLPITMGISLTLINYLTIKQLFNSRKLEVIVLIFSIINFNTVRLVTDLHRNLFSLILVELALFIMLPKYLNIPTKTRGAILVLSLVISGLSQIETFFIAIFALFCLFLWSLSSKSLKKAKHILVIAVACPLLVLLLNSPFLLAFLGKHILFSSTSRPVPEVEDYLKFLGGPLLAVAFYLLGLPLSIRTYIKKRKELPLLLFIWNVLLLSGSLLPFFGVGIPSWRFLLLTSVPIISVIGLTILSEWKVFVKIGRGNLIQINTILIVCTLLILTPLVSIHYKNHTPEIFRPWISSEAYGKLMSISTLDRTNPSIFVMYFGYGIWTDAYIHLNQNWVRAILGPDTYVYFGRIHSLLLGLPTPCSNEQANLTSYLLWEEVSHLDLSESDVYVIDDWYQETNITTLVEIYPGIYKLSKERFDQGSFFLGLADAYNHTKNSYGRSVEWSPRMILEVYEDPFDERYDDPTFFQVSYLVPMSDEVNYVLRIRWFDYPSRMAPITIKLDGKNITSLTYNGTRLPQTVEIPLPKVGFGSHLLSLEIVGHLDKVHIMSLAYIELVPRLEGE